MGEHEDEVPRDTTDSDARRQTQRAGIVLQLEYRNAGHLLVSYCTNLSRGGLFIPTTDAHEPGTRLTLQLDVPGKPDPVSLAAEVRWLREFATDEGPAGMGLAFEGVDGLLGEQIDGIVARFAPLQVKLVGTRATVWTHVAAQLRSLVACETYERELEVDDPAELRAADLVIVDVDSAPTEALSVLVSLSDFRRPPPRVALCTAQDLSMAGRAARHARVVHTPVDGQELRAAVLECVTRVYAHRLDKHRRDEHTGAPDTEEPDSGA